MILIQEAYETKGNQPMDEADVSIRDDKIDEIEKCCEDRQPNMCDETIRLMKWRNTVHDK